MDQNSGKRQWVEREIGGIYIDSDNFEGPIEDIIIGLERIRDDAIDKGYRNISIDNGPGYDNDIEFEVKGERLETVKEMKRRLLSENYLAQERKEEKIKEEIRERELYKELRRKYSDEN